MARKGAPAGTCKVCNAPAEVRGKVDYLLAAGEPARSVATQFGLPPHSVWRHGRNHITDQYRRAVQLGAHRSEEEFRKLLAEEGVSVAQNLRAVYGGLLSRWLLAIESGNDQAVIGLSREIHSNLRLRAQLGRELMPNGPSVVVNNTAVSISGDWLQSFAAELVEIGKVHPEVRPALVAMLKRRLGPDATPELVNVMPRLEHAHG
jgi:hypothetical protein